ncbi:M20 family metallopeptidase [Bacillus sp. DTU_2020_1000418_1_SI_GHA_SEK_038]|uniref:M20 family metallopeptidase n=1 Tax=Bacillus sp. DTU_2020_1000418_1_SI_GHA_SEK_038 TaxID=3077585 RepID=UPI0028ECBBF5|nr:M20 family metallopeptidase [Bacillus sp. DTU_2020_1000418_1_SI_GHA_SEK_038]WNS75780.1 M20 family metallopeptidase [Bacillus sp. DTU_2020_1000418_1_SI_GHA_SEK_038]
MKEIVSFLQEKQSEMVDKLKQLVEMESPSNDKELVDKIGEKIADLFESYTGGKITVIPNNHFGNHLRGEWGEGEDGQILLLAHMDTVWPKDILQTLPFRIEGDKAYGPGAFDMKGGIVQGIFALHALKELNISPKRKIIFLFTSDEEIGSGTSRQLIEEEAKKSSAVFVLESAASKEGALKTARKGVGIFNLKVKGIAAHSGIEPEKGISAISELASQITYLDSLSDYSKGTTLNVGVIKGGSSSNVVAAEAMAEVDLRVTANKEFDRVIPLIQDLQSTIEGTKIMVEGGINRPPFERSQEVEELYLLAKNIAKEYLSFDLMEQLSGGGSDGNFASQYAPTLDGLGPVGDGAHANHEHAIISQLPVRSALLALLIKELG